jgi:Zn-dependent protease
MKFARREVKELFVAWVFISLAFAILFTGVFNLFDSYTIFVVSFIMSGLTVGIGFLLHEVMHKYVAQRYGLNAEFYAFYGMLWLALLFSLFGFILAAPGAVAIRGRITKERNGKISLAGPLTNVVLAIVFLIPFIFYKEGLLGLFLNYGFTINSLLALFNMIPFVPFDGGKIYGWNKIVWWITTIFAGLLFFGSFLI